MAGSSTGFTDAVADEVADAEIWQRLLIGSGEDY